MSKIKEKKLKQLSRARIWPSVLFLLFSILTAVIAFGIFAAYTLFSQTGERFFYLLTNATAVIRSLDDADGREADILKEVEDNPAISDSIFILDDSGNVIAGFGEATYETDRDLDTPPAELLESMGIPLDLDEYSFYMDSSRGQNLFDEEGALRLDSILFPENFKVFQNPDNKPEDVLFVAKFWIGSELSGGRRALVRCTAPLYFRDFTQLLATALKACSIMLLPILFFFINMLMNISTQRRMTKLLYTDMVTGGNSYVYFEQTADRALNARRNAGKLFMVVDLTLMKYRSYCNFHGVRAGEAMLEGVDKALLSCLNKGEISAHSGKSSFALLLKCSDEPSGEERINTLISDLGANFGHCDIVFHAGLYFFTPQKGVRNTDPADCFSRASAARASLSDDNIPGLAVYNDKLLEADLWAHKVEEKMQTALDNEEFKVYIQPKYEPVTEQLAGGEALIRWINEEDGFISPGRFIPIFENNGFITKIDDYMITHVAKLQAEWLAQGKTVVPISVNVSRAHFADPDLAQHICALVDEHHVPHHLVEIELTESAFFDDKAALLKTVHELQDLGFDVSMDDFGAGYSSLNSLKDLPLNVLKLDAEFFRGEDEENRGEIVVAQAIRLAKSLNMRIVAEGVEKKEQVDFLAGQGCDMIQGFYFAKPMPADEYEQRLT